VLTSPLSDWRLVSVPVTGVAVAVWIFLITVSRSVHGAALGQIDTRPATIPVSALDLPRL